MTIFEKLKILADSAKYDVACTSSGVDRVRQPGDQGSAVRPAGSATALRRTGGAFPC